MHTKKIPYQIAGLPFVLVLLMILLAGVAYKELSPQEEPLLGDVHVHADFKVYLEGVPYNFAQEKYMSDDSTLLSPFTHLHDMNGEVIHKHMSGITLDDFFDSIGMSFTPNCFILDDGTAYCDKADQTLKFYVNGEPNRHYQNYEIQDLDQILISYGSEDDEGIQAQLQSISDEACIYSETCPERGTAPEEVSCTRSEEICTPATH